MLAKLEADPAYLELDVEDVHSFVEERLGEIVGRARRPGAPRPQPQRADGDGAAPLGARRDRRACARGIADARRAPSSSRAGSGADAVMPGYTHTRAAEPITFGHWAAAHAWGLVRDRERLRDARARVDVLPLGSGALAGTSLPLDREAMAPDLGFAAVSRERARRRDGPRLRGRARLRAARSSRRTSRASPRT